LYYHLVLPLEHKRICVLIGKNDDNKFFVNKLDASNYLTKIIENHELNNLTKLLRKDTLMYEYELEEKSFKIGNTYQIFLSSGDVLSIRVQGDLVFNIATMSFGFLERTYLEAFRELIKLHLGNSLETILVDYLITELTKLRLSCVYNNRRHFIRIPTTPFNHVFTSKIRDSLKEEFNKILLKKMKDLGRKLGCYATEKDIIDLNVQESVITIYFDWVYLLDFINQVIDKNYNISLKEYLKEIPYTLNVGNHTIICSSYPHNIILSLKNVLTDEPFTINIRIDNTRIYTTNDITIIHDEHPKKKIRFLFPKDKIVAIRTDFLNLGISNMLNRNHIAIKELVEERV
jgi:hypothetical protein